MKTKAVAGCSTHFLLTLICLVIFISVSQNSFAGEVVKSTRTDASLKHEVENAIGKGLSWLAKQQNNEGWWSQQEHPALTALVLTGFQGEPTGYYKNKYKDVINKGYSYIEKKINPDGGIYEKGLAHKALANYNTSIVMMALVSSHNPEYTDIIKNARNFITGLQYDAGKRGMGDSPVDGGVGYGGSYTHPDLSNTVYALEALYYTRNLSDTANKTIDMKELNWDAAIQFISRTQNLPGPNDQSWASDDPDNKGGFIYFPGDSKAGEIKLANGKTALRSYGSMSYAGLLSYIYAQMDRDDPRIKAVHDWLSHNYTLAENPGLGQQGLYYYYQMMAKGLSIYGEDTIKLSDGKTVNWRQDLSKHLLNLQQQDGSWVNENGRWWEKDPVLVTSYSLITLEIILRGL